ncbi:hypothetical protein K502DRAFT_67162 [Neoconidiobolus thromboides FSU 785]|nr:hypothetical protein K502DRAFT_67162 [Neoconidiobolus thromboides FSU 785]
MGMRKLLSGFINSKLKKVFYNGYFIDKADKSLVELFKPVREFDEYYSIYEKKGYYFIEGIYICDYGGRLLMWVITFPFKDGYWVCPNMKAESETTHPNFFLDFVASLIPLLHHDAGSRGVFITGLMKQVLQDSHKFDKSFLRQDNLLLLTLTTKALKIENIGLNLLVNGNAIMDIIQKMALLLTRLTKENWRIICKKFSMDILRNEYLAPLFVDEIQDDDYNDREVIKVGKVVKNKQILATKLKFNSDRTIEKYGLNSFLYKDSIVTDAKYTDSKVVIEAKHDYNMILGDKMV